MSSGRRFFSSPSSSAAAANLVEKPYWKTLKHFRTARRAITAASPNSAKIASSLFPRQRLLAQQQQEQHPAEAEIECGIGIAPPSGLGFTSAVFSSARRNHVIEALMRQGVISRTRYWDEATLRCRWLDTTCEFVPDNSLRLQQEAFLKSQQKQEEGSDDGGELTISNESADKQSEKRRRRRRNAGRGNTADSVFVFSRAFTKTDLAGSCWFGPDTRNAVREKILLSHGNTQSHQRVARLPPLLFNNMTHSQFRALLCNFRRAQRLGKNAAIAEKAARYKLYRERYERKQQDIAASGGDAHRMQQPQRKAYSSMYRHLAKQQPQQPHTPGQVVDEDNKQQPQQQQQQKQQQLPSWPQATGRRGLGIKWRFRNEVRLSGSSQESRQNFVDILGPMPFSAVEYRFRRVYCCPALGVQIHVTSSRLMRRPEGTVPQRRRKVALAHLGNGKIALPRVPFHDDDNNNDVNERRSHKKTLDQLWRGHSSHSTMEVEMMDPLALNNNHNNTAAAVVERVHNMFLVANAIIEIAFPEHLSRESKRLRQKEQQERQDEAEAEALLGKETNEEGVGAAPINPDDVGGGDEVNEDDDDYDNGVVPEFEDDE